jgi:uncharacterized membrane protein YjjP (DUF1212 family)
MTDRPERPAADRPQRAKPEPAKPEPATTGPATTGPATTGQERAGAGPSGAGYPGARPHTDGLPKTQPLTAAQMRQNAAAKKMLRRLVQGENPPTAPLSIVDRLAGSPYANPTIQVGGVDTSARKTLDFALHLAETMFRYGAGALEVETSIIAVTAALGLKNIEVDITNQSVGINYAPKDQTPIALLRVVRSWTNNYAGLAKVHQLVTDIVAGGVGRDEAIRRLNEAITSPKPFPRWMVTVAFGIFAAAFVGVLGGGPVSSAIAFVANIAISLLARQLGRWRVPDFFITASCSFVVTQLALLLWQFGLTTSPAIVVVGGILLLLPTGRLVSSVQDAINGFPVTAAGRFLSTLLTFGAIVAGIAVAFVVGELTGMQRIDVTQTFPPAYDLWVLVILVAVAVMAIGITEQTTWQLLLPTAAVGVAGYFVLLGGGLLGIGDRFSPALAAVVIGLLARVVALRLGAPQLVVAVPAALILLPGLTIFRSMYVLTIEEAEILLGAGGMLSAGAIVLGTAGGIVLGDTLARPLTRSLASNERRRARRR